jgi:hypothetical protein
MSADASRRGLRVLLAVLGTVMVVAGAATVLFGASSVPREEIVAPDVDSEMRFYAVWYVAGGVALLRALTRVERSSAIVRLIACGFFVAGCARVVSWASVGKPHAFLITLMVIELVLPAIILPWQAAVARRAEVALPEER